MTRPPPRAAPAIPGTIEAENYDVATPGDYTPEMRVASGVDGGSFHVEFDGVDKTGPITILDITQNGQTYAEGLGVHAYFEVQVFLDGNYTRFISDVGLDDEETTSGSAQFEVWSDGLLLYQSPIMGPSCPAQTVDVDVSGRQNLVLIVTNGGDGIGHDHADWAGAQLIP